MIPNQLVEVRIDKYGEHYKKLGYAFKHTKCWLRVPPWHLLNNSNKIVIAVCDSCSDIFKGKWQTLFTKFERDSVHLCSSCSYNHKVEIMTGQNNPFWNPKKSVFRAYSNRVHLLTAKTYEKHKDEINPFGLKRTKMGIDGGYQLDHIFPIKRGFEEGIRPEVLAEKNNLQIITWQENRQKSSINTRINLKEK